MTLLPVLIVGIARGEEPASETVGGEVEGQIDLDVLHAQNRSAETGAGEDDTMSNTELGSRVRVDAEAGRWGLALDYNGRDPLGGNASSSAVHLLYTGEVSYEIIEDTLQVAAGRFLGPAVVFLPVDGARFAYEVMPGHDLRAFGGRRGVTTSRSNVPFDVFLPAAGASYEAREESWMGTALVAYAEDEALLGTAETNEIQTFGSLQALARATVYAHDEVTLGGTLSFAQRAAYVLGPLREDATVEVEALDLFQAIVWTEWRPTDRLRLDYDFQHQEAALWAEGFVGDDGELDELVDPGFTDNRLKLAVAPWTGGWIRPDVRLRLRPDRTELRYGVALEARDIGLDGPFVEGSATVDDIVSETAKDDIGSTDHLFWSASTGWRRDELDLEVGASFVERAAVPVSGRVSDVTNPGLPSESDDLSLFVLEAQDVAFVRAFYGARRWFVGADFEQSLHDDEFRVLVMAGTLLEKRW